MWPILPHLKHVNLDVSPFPGGGGAVGADLDPDCGARGLVLPLG
jgi:hypothetical protein